MLVTNLVLAGVTAAYVVLTKKLAASSEAAAESARRAAEAAERSAAASVASVDVQFSVYGGLSVPKSVQDGNAVEVILECEGAAVFVHGAVLDGVATAHQIKGGAGTRFEHLATDVPLRVSTPAEVLPRKMHRGERIRFRTDPEVVVKGRTMFSRTYNAIGLLQVTVEYSIDGSDDRFYRKVDWLADLSDSSEDESLSETW